MKAVRVLLRLHWGFSVKYPTLSATQPSFRAPPPLTLIGALSYPLSLLEGKPEVVLRGGLLYSSAVELLDAIPWVAFRFDGLDPRWLVETRDLTRVLIAPYVRSAHVYPYSPNLWGVQMHGKIYAPAATLDVVYLVRDGVEQRVARAAWGLVRLGVKEAIVSVHNVTLHDVEAVEAKHVETSYSFPARLGEVDEFAEVLRVELPAPTRDWYVLGKVKPSIPLEEYIIPVETVTVEPREHALVLRINGIGYIVAPKEVVR